MTPILLSLVRVDVAAARKDQLHWRSLVICSKSLTETEDSSAITCTSSLETARGCPFLLVRGFGFGRRFDVKAIALDIFKGEARSLSESSIRSMTRLEPLLASRSNDRSGGDDDNNKAESSIAVEASGGPLEGLLLGMTSSDGLRTGA